MINVQYGILKELYLNNKFGVRAMVANVTIRENGEQPIDDAALILVRRSFGVGRSHLVLRQSMHGVLDPGELIQMAYDAAIKLFGSADKNDVHKLADLLLDYTDELVMHPPEDQMRIWKQERRMIEQSQALIKLNDEVILDAR